LAAVVLQVGFSTRVVLARYRDNKKTTEMSDYALQRLNMVESQVRPSDVVDRRVIRAMLALPREEFVPQFIRSVCYTDRDLPLAAPDADGPKRFVIQPRVQAKLIQALELPDDGICLDVGAGMGYSSAVLSRICQTVIGIEPDEAMLEAGREAFVRNEIENVVLFASPLTEGRAEEGPYDGIILNGAVDFVPDSLLDQLKDGGKLLAVVNDGGVGHATEYTRTGNTFGRRALFEATIEPLPGFQKAASFSF
jgi:protein-L-isoaspartate(D-aspartate) O-methyltransferase